MKRAKQGGGQSSKKPMSGALRKQARRAALSSTPFEPATDAGVDQQPRASKKARPVVACSDATVIRRPPGRSTSGRAAGEAAAPLFDAISVAEQIEACRARVANLTELADVTARTLYELYDYDSDDPELCGCCDLIRQVLKQAHSALIPLGIASHDTAPRARAAEIAIGCETQRQWLRPAVHVIRATIHVLIDVKFDDHDEVLPALRDLEGGLLNVVAALEGVVQRCAYRARRGTGR